MHKQGAAQLSQAYSKYCTTVKGLRFPKSSFYLVLVIRSASDTASEWVYNDVSSQKYNTYQDEGFDAS